LLQPRRLAATLAALFAVVTVIYIGIDAFMRHATRTSSGGQSAAALENLLFFSPYLRRVPTWYSATGLVFLGVVAVWWLAVPYAPALLLGASDRALELAPAWLRFYWPIAALLAAGI